MAQSIIFRRSGGININIQDLITSFIALFLALVFNDLKVNILDNVILKIALHKMEKKKYKVYGVEINMENIIKCLIHVIIAIIFLVIIYFLL
jgi:hypothetical protein